MWLKIKVLLWKSLQQRKKRWLCTVIEIIVPCLLFYFLSYILFYTATINKDAQKIEDQTIPTPISFKTLISGFKKKYSSENLIFSPNTSNTEKIIKNFVKASGIPYSKIETVSNEGEMIKKFRDKSNNTKVNGKNFGFGVVFEEIIVKSRIFKYKIRSTSDDYNTELLFPENEIQGPMNSDKAYIENGFLALQFLLDFSFIYLDDYGNGSTMAMAEYNLKLQSYPYKKFLRTDSLFEQIFPLFTVIIFLLMYLQTIKTVVEEKYSGIKELMKMMGLKSWMMWAGWILHILIVHAISITAMTYMSCIGTYKILNYTNPFLFWIFLVMYLISGILFCFAICGLFNRPLFALSISCITWIFSYSLPANLPSYATSNVIYALYMLLPNACLLRFTETISFLETQEIGLKFSSILTTKKADNSFSVCFILFMLIIDGLIYGLIAWYLDSVMPGKYGVAKPLYFVCKWPKTKPKDDVIAPITEARNNTFFESPPNNYEVGISVMNLHKQFGKFHAVNGVTLDLYKGQITALLGHNGAGKTTTMSIITGIYFTYSLDKKSYTAILI